MKPTPPQLAVLRHASRHHGRVRASSLKGPTREALPSCWAARWIKPNAHKAGLYHLTATGADVLEAQA